jgi:AcrR family transcriptional regulator
MYESAINELVDAKPGDDKSPRRAKAIDAFIDLVLEGHLPPTTSQVAERSGISAATFFRYFDTLDQLRAAAFLRMVERFPLLPIEDLGHGTRKERVDRFVASRFAATEKLHLLAQLQRSQALRDPGAAEMIDTVRRVMAEEARKHFAPEIATLTETEADDAVALIASVTSVESWEHFRRAFDRSPQQTQRAWVRGVEAILTKGSKK